MNAVLGRLREPWFIAILLFFVFRIGASYIFDLSARCQDGWTSPSIGTQGACSHHGGVDNWRAVAAFFASVCLSALIVWVPILFRENAEKEAKRVAENEARERRDGTSKREIANKSAPKVGAVRILAPEGTPPCPIHGRMVESVDLKRWTCVEYPNCEYFWIKSTSSSTP